jgi:hypothetical protein
VATADFFSVEVFAWVGVVRLSRALRDRSRNSPRLRRGIVRDLHQLWGVNATRALLDRSTAS